MDYEDRRVYLINHGWQLVNMKAYSPETWKNTAADRTNWPLPQKNQVFWDSNEAFDFQRRLSQQRDEND